MTTTIAKQDQVHHYSHLAMATTFEIRIRHDDESYARQAAWDAFALLDRLESDLTRYDDNSDISRLNALPPGEIMVLGEAAYACLAMAQSYYEVTEGAFDITAGGLKEFWRESPSFGQRWFALRRVVIGMHHLHLEEGGRVWKDAPVQVDLGAIGKGYAVDRMTEQLQEWQITDLLLHGGASSVAARGSASGTLGWPVTLRHPHDKEKILLQFELAGQAMGASGVEKGGHIIHPRTGKPARNAWAAWVIAADATAADAISTALMVKTRQATKAFLDKRRDLGALVLYQCGDSEEIEQTLDVFRRGTKKHPCEGFQPSQG